MKLTTLRLSKRLDAHRGAGKTVTGDPATFTVTCLPKAKGTPAGKDAAGGGGGNAHGGTAVAKSD